MTVRLAPLPPMTTAALGISDVLLLVRVTVSRLAALSASPTVKARPAVEPSSLMVWFAMFVMVGASLTALTVTVNVSVAVREPSLTVRVIVAVPLEFATGVAVTVRLAPLPPRTTPASGNSVVFELVRVTVRAADAVS